MKFDFIDSLSKTKTERIYIFHVMKYLFRFSIIFLFETVNAKNVMMFLKQIFARYIKFMNIYCDQNHHFQNTIVEKYLFELNISFTFSSSDASQNTEIIENENRLLKNVLRRTTKKKNWNQVLFKIIHDFNVCVIHHLKTSPMIILFEMFSDIFIIENLMRKSLN